MTSITFIGDPHGWSDRLQQVVDQAPDRIVVLGDLIDRGPDSRGVIRICRELEERGRLRCILGNHELALLKAMGIPHFGYEPDDYLFELWSIGYDGHTVLSAYDATTMDELRAAMGSDLDWLRSLPHVLWGEEDGRGWMAVHAALDPAQPAAVTLGRLADPQRSENWAGHPYHLYEKRRQRDLPFDLPANTCVASGHVPQDRPWIDQSRILCDTTGGKSGRRLAGVVWPHQDVLWSA
ncbi:hypothetical protein LBMAG53_37990 [Planctomycetota bacterium]|nr:hypothetical protein LBMAG53_37990 [Planctomycetota bacterium]